MSRELLRTAARAVCFVAWIPVAVTARDNLLSFSIVTGSSMSPVLNPPQSWFRDWLLINKLTRRTNYKRGDVVIFRSMELPDKTLVKRLVGLPGDFISFDDIFTRGFVHVPKGYCWVQGDNAATSQDSRQYGPIPIGLLDGRVECIIWPPHRIRRIHQQNFANEE